MYSSLFFNQKNNFMQNAINFIQNHEALGWLIFLSLGIILWILIHFSGEGGKGVYPANKKDGSPGSWKDVVPKKTFRGNRFEYENFV